jgi:osmotically-inducible protein OsmY
MALLSHRSTSNLRTTVATSAGVVTLGGTAKNTAEVDLVTKLVTDIHGVSSVVNQMTVQTPAAAAN